ncbi:SRPBCC family protein [Streptomyces albidoflavus]
MAVDVTVETVIERPIEVVAAYAADPSHAPEWYANIRAVAWRTQPPVRLGTRVDFEARFLGRSLAYTYEVVAFEPGRLLVMQTAEGPFPMRTTYAWEALTAGSTRMTLRNTGNPSGFAKLSAPVMERAMRRATSKDLARIKGILERA